VNARALFAASAPVHPERHWFDERHVLLANGNRIYALNEDARRRFESGELDLAAPPYIGENEVPFDPPLRAISLAVAQKCNLGCTYCYAQQGEFGGPAKNMPLDVALRAVELLFRDAGRGDRVNISFLGGEPLFNRPVLRAATERTCELAREKDVRATFSITTNGTLLREDDAEFFEAHAFAVTISVDGLGEVHDRTRPRRNGGGSFDALLARAQPLLAAQRAMQVSARVTVTPHNLALRETLDGLIALGFHSVGFSPMLRSPSGTDELSHDDLEAMLEQMVDCGDAFERALVEGRRYPFANAVNALREIHRGTHRPYPCGAGASYAGVSADGELSACHRFVGDAEGAMGDLEHGLDRERQRAWLAERHVHRQEPCRECWARYLCGGGCHHEVIARGRPACDYIRGWLHYCLGAYVRLLARRPDWFGA